MSAFGCLKFRVDSPHRHCYPRKRSSWDEQSELAVSASTVVTPNQSNIAPTDGQRPSMIVEGQLVCRPSKVVRNC